MLQRSEYIGARETDYVSRSFLGIRINIYLIISLKDIMARKLEAKPVKLETCAYCSGMV